jgi:tRNA-dihydrouridine synthase B
MEKFTWKGSKKPIFILAPMANITTISFRSICKEMGADVVFTPMVSSNAILYNEKEALKVGAFLDSEQPVIVQLYGYSGELMANAAKVIDEKLHPAGIDINMGCPAKKIVGNESGSALLKDLDNALEIIKEIRDAYKGQLSVKLRLGWKDFEILDFAKELERLGVDAITVHGRTTKQGYSGTADWEKIYQIADTVDIPVIGNGDIKTWQEAYQRFDNSKLRGVMIGRGALGNPWIFKEIKEKRDFKRTPKTIASAIAKQKELYLKHESEINDVRELRKHLGWYIKGFPNATAIKVEAMGAEKADDIENIIKKLVTK